MKSVNFILFLLTIFSMISCEEKTFNDLTGEGTLLKEIVIEGEIYNKYTYNEADLVKEEKNKFQYNEHHYNSKNQLIRTDLYMDESVVSSSLEIFEQAMNRTDWVTPDNTEMDAYIIFDYTGNGQLKKTTHFDLNNETSSYFTYVYNDNKIEKKMGYRDNEPTSLEIYFYDQYDNLIQVEKYLFNSEEIPKIITSTQYYLDKENNSYISFRALMTPGKYTNKNNIIKEVYTIYANDGTFDDVQTTEYTYEYNEKGFPVKRSDGIEYTYY